MGVFQAAPIGAKAWLILEGGFCAMYYLEGTERGLLIDTGVGIEDLKAFVDKLATKPYDVVLTHGHFDHVGGIWQHGQIYAHRGDWDMALGTTDETRRNFIEQFEEMSEGRSTDQSSQHMLLRGENPEMIPVEDGQVFDLGGRTVAIMETPGHTKGCICLHDSLTNFLFVGDSVIYRLLLLHEDWDCRERASRWRKSMEPIFSRWDSYTAVYCGHSGKVERETVKELLALTDKLIAHPDLIDAMVGEKKIRMGDTQIFLELPFSI